MLAGLIIPLLSRYLLADRKKFDMIASKTFKVFFLIAVPIVIGTLFLAKDIILIVSGQAFLASADVLRILIFSLSFIFFGHFFNMILLVANAQKKLMWTLSSAAVFNIAMNLTLIPRFSYIGSALASALTEMFVVGATSYIAFQHIGYRPSFRGLWTVVLSGIGMAAFLFSLHGKLPFTLLGFSAVFVYGFLLWALKGVTKEEVNIILSGRKLARDSQAAEHTETIV
jgi:O-antigen/teichoic acid export membrane protein